MNKAQAKSLAVRYHAFLDAMHADDIDGIILWGPMLAEIQNTTRIWMLGASTIDGLVANARRSGMKQAA